MYCTNCGTHNPDTNKFCTKCGSQLGSIPPEGTPVPDDSYPSFADNVGVNQTTIKRFPKKYLLIGLGAVLTSVVIILLISLWPSPKEKILFGEAEEFPGAFSSIFQLNKDDLEEVDSVRRSRYLYRPTNPFGEKNFYFSPDGKYFVLFECEQGRGCDINLYGSKNDLIENFTMTDGNDDVGFLNLFNGFSPDSKYFAYIVADDYDNERLETVIVNMKGDEVISLRDKLFGGFSPDSKGVVILNYDWDIEGVDRIEYVKLRNEDATQISDDEMDDLDDFVLANPFFANKNDTVYYSNGDIIYKVDIDKASPERLYRCESHECLAYYAEEVNKIVILDPYENGYGELILVDPDNESETVFEDVAMSAYGSIYSTGNDEAVIFSPNGKNLAFLKYLSSGDNIATLIISDLQGKNETEITEAERIDYQFSPDSKKIAYIEYADFYDERFGELYIVDRDGENSVRLDKDVGSFKFTTDGKYIVYVKLDQFRNGDYESEVLKIRIDGKKEEVIFGPENNIFMILK